MIKTKSFVHQLPSVCTVIQYVYIYIHKSMVEYTPQPPPGKLSDRLQCLFASQ